MDRRRAWALGFAAVVVLAACGVAVATRPTPSPGQSPVASASPSPSTSPSPPPSPSPTARPVSAGAPAWVAVAVASGWRAASSPRSIDAPALENPSRVRDWVAAMSVSDQLGLIDRLDTQLLLDDEVEVTAVSGSWARVTVPDQATPLDAHGYPVWIPIRQLTTVAPPDASSAVVVTRPVARVGTSSWSLEVSYGTAMPVLADNGSTYTVGLAGGLVGSVDKTAVATPAQAPVASAIVAAARSLVSVPYLWGGTSGFGFDCSGLVHIVYKANGVILPRDSDPQSRIGTAVLRANLLPGDLVFFSSGGVAYHVAIYSGSGNVIESPTPGGRVREVALSSLPYAGDYSGARRVVAAPAQPSPSPSPASGLPASLAGAEWTTLPTSDKVVALTFDAGGNNAGVAPVLKALADAGVPATFFLTGRWTEVYPADARRIAASYPVGNHTYSHPHLTQLTDSAVIDEITHAASVIRNTTGRDPHPLFRFPYGSVDARLLADAHAQGYGGIRWTVDTLGWEGRGLGQSETTVLNRVLGSLRPGEIVLMHVGAATDGSTLDASALPAVISAVQARGYHFVLISDYVR